MRVPVDQLIQPGLRLPLPFLMGFVVGLILCIAGLDLSTRAPRDALGPSLPVVAPVEAPGGSMSEWRT